MFPDENSQSFELGNRMIITDPTAKVCFSVNAEYFKKCNLSDTNNPIFKILTEQREIHKRSDEETNTIHSVYLFVTRECNLSCPFCSMRSNDKTGDFYKQKLTLGQVSENIIPFLKTVHPRRFIVSGGEPFTNVNIIQILRALKENFTLCDISVQTNGLLITEQLIQNVEKILSRLEISTAHFEGQFDHLEYIISLIKRHGIECTLSFVYNQNMNSLEKVLDIAAKYNISLLLNFVSPDGSALDDKMSIMSSEERVSVYKHVAQYILDKQYTNKLKFADIFFQRVYAKMGCGALGSTIVIFPDGNIYPCHSLEVPELRIGNITDEPLKLKSKLKEINCSKVSQSLFNVKLKEPCKECKLRFVCGGFCGATQYHGSKCDCDLKKIWITFNLLFFDASTSFSNNLVNFINFIENRNYKKYFN